MERRDMWLNVIWSALLMTTLCTGLTNAAEIVGEIEFPACWTIFAPLEREDPLLPPETLRTIPAELMIAGRTVSARTVEPTNNQFDFKPFLGEPAEALDRVAYVFVPLQSPAAQDVTLGMGADDKLQVWVNGVLILDTTEGGNRTWPPTIEDHQVNVHLKQGTNILAARFRSGKACSVMALGGPTQLRAGDFWTIIPDPLAPEAESPQYPPVQPGDKPVANIDSRLELFIDDYLVDGTSGGVERRLHHPVPREVVLTLDQPWEGLASAWFSVVQDAEVIRIYYNARPCYPDSGNQTTCLIESRDGIHWRMLIDERAIGKPGGFDSQNLAFWDTERRQYVCYYRHQDPRGRLRGIWRQVSDDFIHWTDPQPLLYEDNRMEHMYHNAIRPYFRAPHIYIGTPARFVPRRKKIAEHPQPGISDAVLMSSRDGIHFQRWKEAFIRPGPEPEVWTDRNNYPAWGMVQTSPEEISLYWTEHYRHPGMRLRRGTIRTDGFVSMHAGGEPGELLTRPLLFTGNTLILNYATSAIGSLRVELCDPTGAPIKGYALADSEVLFGNEIEHTMTWKHKSAIGQLAGRPIRIRVQLEDADLYSIRFSE